MFRAELVECKNMRIVFDLGCPFLTCELEGESNIWTRNGSALTDSGEVLAEGYEVTLEGPIPK
ncbi:hypothetical protein FRUB_09055 [Fimbriiglobus ruber]|uniref:Uncharacterized protein n=1 Tax=Fimbriiglobus ruber TaxID=1908690 RepID=A0A225D4S0_9BACT|nr:hypothetical protein FRUB_09055 [Fimbriiglobus ruber]